MKKSAYIFLLLLGLSIALEARPETSDDTMAKALEIGSEIEITDALESEDDLKEKAVDKKWSCYCEQRSQRDIHRKYCVGDEKDCQSDTSPVDFLIDYFEAKIIKDQNKVETANGYYSLSACREYLARRADCLPH